MLDTVREFAAERAGDLTEAGLRHAHYFVDYCERLATEAARAHRRDSLERLALERANIRLAYERLVARRGRRRGAARGDRLRPRAAVGRAHAGGARLARAPAPTRPRLRATALYWDGRLAISQARLAEAEPRLRAALDAAREAGDRHLEGGVLIALGRWATLVASPEAAELRDAALATARATGDRQLIADALLIGAGVCERASDWDGAVALATEALEIYRELGDPYGAATALAELGWYDMVTASAEHAEEYLDEALELRRRFGDDRRLVEPLIDGAWLALVQGDTGDRPGALPRLPRPGAPGRRPLHRGGGARRAVGGGRDRVPLERLRAPGRRVGGRPRADRRAAVGVGRDAARARGGARRGRRSARPTTSARSAAARCRSTTSSSGRSTRPSSTYHPGGDGGGGGRVRGGGDQAARSRAAERAGRAAGADRRRSRPAARAGRRWSRRRPASARRARLTEWAAASPARFAWVSLDAGDDDPSRFWSYVVAAVEGAAPELPGTAGRRLRGPRRLDRRRGPARARQRAHDARRSRSCSSSTTTTRSRTRRSTPACSTCSSGSGRTSTSCSRRWTVPPLRLGRLRARGELNECRADTLRFSEAEVAALLNGAHDLRLAPDELAGLYRRTEGWVAGLNLVALSLRETGDRAAFLAGMPVDDRFLVDYLWDEVVARQPPDTRDFLMRTAVLERLSSELCDAVLERPRQRRDAARARAQQPVRDPARRRPPLVPLPHDVPRHAAAPARALRARRRRRPAPPGERLVRRSRRRARHDRARDQRRRRARRRRDAAAQLARALQRRQGERGDRLDRPAAAGHDRRVPGPGARARRACRARWAGRWRRSSRGWRGPSRRRARPRTSTSAPS